MSLIEIELPPLIDDAFELPVDKNDDGILVDPSIVDRKIKKYIQLQSSSLSDKENIATIIPDTDEPMMMSGKQLKDIVLTQLVQYSDSYENIEELVDTGMKLCGNLMRNNSEYHEIMECGFEEMLSLMLARSWVPKTTAKSLSAYVHKFLHGKENIEWTTVKNIYDFVFDENTLILIYLVTYCYTLAMCSPQHSYFSSYPGYYIEDLDKFIENGIKITRALIQTNIEWHGIIIRSSGQTLLHVMPLTEWFVVSILGLQTGYLGFKLGEKIWILMHSLVGTCKSKGKLDKKEVKQIIDKAAKNMFQK